LKKPLLLIGGVLVLYYVYKTYIQHNTALPGSFPTIGIGGHNTAGPPPVQTQVSFADKLQSALSNALP
jgi:hypothetical protein